MRDVDNNRNADTKVTTLLRLFFRWINIIMIKKRNRLTKNKKSQIFPEGFVSTVGLILFAQMKILCLCVCEVIDLRIQKFS